MTPLERLQCVRMSFSPLRVRIERAILRQKDLGQLLKTTPEEVNNPIEFREKDY